MDENELTRRFMKGQPEGLRSRGRPKLRWKGVGEDLRRYRILANKGWWLIARDRVSWRKISRKTEARTKAVIFNMTFI